MLKNKELLQESKNLLAFSAGVDSTALFFLLLEHNISFDIAIVHYHTRPQAEEEVAYAKELAKNYNLKCYIYDAPKIEKNFEAQARAIRYDFFDALIAEHNYTTLLTAHHLGDRFEWMLMQFCKGAGCVEISGMKPIEKQTNHTLVRPLLHLDKQELLEYLHTNKIKYFEDASNKDSKYKRNVFRHEHTNPLLAQYLQGIKKSFEYLDADVEALIEEIEVKRFNKLAYFENTRSTRSNIRAIDRYLKSVGTLVSAYERRLLKENNSVVISRKYIVSQNREYTFIAPYIKATDMTKELKEKFRVIKIDPKLRGYLASDAEVEAFVSLLLE